jgi:hypothetical protein
MFQTRVAERLIQSRGEFVLLQQELNRVTNDLTGNVTINTRSFKLKVIPITKTTAPQIEEDLSYLASNRQYTFGALFDTVTTQFIGLYSAIKNLDVRIDDYIIWNGSRCRIAKIQAFPDRNTMILGTVASAETGGIVYPVTVATHLRLSVEVNLD